jgi:glucose-1-phosphate thymidylyltransferase
MQCIILCAGFATRLYPLTRNKPKQLLPLGSRCVLDHLMDRLLEAGLRHAAVVCNHQFIHQFEQWRSLQQPPISLNFIDNGVTCADQRRGSVGDLHLVFESLDLREDFLVLHGDNLFTFSLRPVLQAFQRQGNTLVTFDVGTAQRARRAGQVTCNHNGRIIDFVEKPHHPRSTQVSIGIYAFRSKIRRYIQMYVADGLPTDHSGDLISWLHRQVRLFAYPISTTEGIWFDIGTPQDYQDAKDARIWYFSNKNDKV